MPNAHPDHPNILLFNHPLIQHKLTVMRDRATSHRPFRALLEQIAGLMVYEVTRTFPSLEVDVESPMERTRGTRVDRSITVCPVLRAGLAMADGVLDMIPDARVGHIGLFRDEKTLKPVTYLSKLPNDLHTGPVILVDPMLATGGSAAAAATMLKDAGALDIRMICLVAAPEGAALMHDAHPDVPIYTAALDRQLNEKGYILPGLGDAGDRLYGTV